jgi:hypothetical protein
MNDLARCGLDSHPSIVRLLGVSPAILHMLMLSKVLWRHYNHGCFLFFGVEKFHYPVLHKSVPAEFQLCLLVLCQSRIKFVLSVILQLLNMFLFKNKIAPIRTRGIVVYNKEGSAYTSSISENLELSVPNVSDHRYFVRD